MHLLFHAIDEAKSTFDSLRPLAPIIEDCAQLMIETIKRGGTVLACGNGGSAADAAHLAAELVVRYRDDRPPYPAMTLGAEGALLTAMGNDYDFDRLFARQLEAFAREGDLLICFSTSGRSPNVIRALETANRLKVRSIAILGKDGGPACGLATREIIVPVQTTARIQEAHTLILHVLCEHFDEQIERTG